MLQSVCRREKIGTYPEARFESSTNKVNDKLILEQRPGDLVESLNRIVRDGDGKVDLSKLGSPNGVAVEIDDEKWEKYAR